MLFAIKNKLFHIFAVLVILVMSFD